MRSAWLTVGLFLAGCDGCNKPASLGPLTTPVPGDLSAKGMVVEQPASGETIKGQWVAVSGWVEPSAVAAVLVVGAPVDGFYLPTGHVGVPTVEVKLGADGRFVAPRVPLQNGATEITILPLSSAGAVFTPVNLSVIGADTAVVPATLVATPPQAEPGKEVVLRASTGTKDKLNWQWDFEGDGTFDEEGASAKHVYPAAGNFAPLARTRVEGRWLYARGKLQIGLGPAVLFGTTEVDDPHQLVAVLERTGDPQVLKYVIALDQTAARVFSPDLKPLAVISGLKVAGGAWVDPQGRFLILDVGNKRIGRYLTNGTLDASFATGGYFTGTAQMPLEGATALGCNRVLIGGKPVGYRPKDDAWTQVTHVEDAWKLSDALKAEATVQVTAEVCQLFSRSSLYLVNGRVARPDLVDALETLPSPKGSVAVAGGLAGYAGDYVVADAAGAVILYRSETEDSTWKLDYPVRALAINPLGQIYVAGPGHLELRDFPRVR